MPLRNIPIEQCQQPKESNRIEMLNEHLELEKRSM
ncbi:hypothetical protein SBY92_001811 [Candida maltosa Xu316]